MSQPKTKIKNRNKKQRRAANERKDKFKQLAARYGKAKKQREPVPATKLKNTDTEVFGNITSVRHSADGEDITAILTEEPKVITVLDQAVFDEYRAEAKKKKRGLKKYIEGNGWTLLDGGDQSEASAWFKEA